MWYNGSVTKPKQVQFRKASSSDIPLNGKQLDMLALLLDAGPEGAAVYGRGPTETVEALFSRGLATRRCLVNVIVMGKLEPKALWILTDKGRLLLG